MLPTLLLAGALAAGSPADIASVPATATIATVTLPGRKEGGRELVLAFKDDGEAAVRRSVGDVLIGLRAFTELVPAGGEYELELRLVRVSRHLGDLEEGRRQRLTMTIEAEWTWRRGGIEVRSGAAKLTPEQLVREAPQRGDVAVTLLEGFHELGRQAFADLFEAQDAGLLEIAQPEPTR